MSSRQRDFRQPRRRGYDDDNYQPFPSPGFSAPRGDFPQRQGGERGPSPDRTPTGPTQRAVVKWFNPEKGFGFVELADGSGDAFLHAAVLERGGHGTVMPGATLEVRTSAGQKGMQVSQVVSVDSSTARDEPVRQPRPDRDRSAAPVSRGPRVSESGSVTFYNAEKGFGFIAPDRGGKDIFVHASALRRAGLVTLDPGQRVTVDVVDGRKGPEAAEIRLGDAADRPGYGAADRAAGPGREHEPMSEE
ncbi:MAG: CspA family cold shock protein [Alphaproteobacteria bacterium]|nr:CspA family cold shock protein [Alphaproteobacteria bacterium]